jgi:hypothetical protein
MAKQGQDDICARLGRPKQRSAVFCSAFQSLTKKDAKLRARPVVNSPRLLSQGRSSPS